jgi:hypothetical protein
MSRVRKNVVRELENTTFLDCNDTTTMTFDSRTKEDVNGFKETECELRASLESLHRSQKVLQDASATMTDKDKSLVINMRSNSRDVFELCENAISISNYLDAFRENERATLALVDSIERYDKACTQLFS